MAVIFPWGQWDNSLWHGDAIWRHGSGLLLVQVMAYWLTAPSHYLNRSWSSVRSWAGHSLDGILLRRSADTNQWNKIENGIFKIAFRSPMDQWIKKLISPVWKTVSVSLSTWDTSYRRSRRWGYKSPPAARPHQLQSRNSVTDCH